MFKTFLKQAGLEEQQHQVEGVEWCLQKEMEGITGTGINNIRGGIIADEMGLGKTIQLVGTIYSNELPHTLIVLPKALLDQWAIVIQKMLKQTPLIYHGVFKKKITAEQLHSNPIIITTYGMLTKSRKSKKQLATVATVATVATAATAANLLHQVNWDRIIFDEAHHMRNKKTNIFQGAALLKSSIKWFVTGTPIQNKRTDLYSLCALLGLPTHYYTKTANIPEICKNFVLRRTKASTALALTLPKLNMHTIHIPWSNESECNLSEDIHSVLKFSKITAADTISHGTGRGRGGDVTLVALLRARQSCILPELLRKNYPQRAVAVAQAVAQEQLMKALGSSSKMDVVLRTILDRKDNGKAKLVFCHFRGEIDYIHTILSSQNVKTETFDGRTNEKTRQSILTDKKIDVLILQIQTGCEGLNLQQFSEVYFISPHWNPAVEDQAIARCHRFGQQEEVDVFRFYMSGFDEENVTNTIDSYSENVQKIKRQIMETTF